MLRRLGPVEGVRRDRARKVVRVQRRVRDSVSPGCEERRQVPVRPGRAKSKQGRVVMALAVPRPRRRCRREKGRGRDDGAMFQCFHQQTARPVVGRRCRGLTKSVHSSVLRGRDPRDSCPGTAPRDTNPGVHNPWRHNPRASGRCAWGSWTYIRFGGFPPDHAGGMLGG